MATISRQSDPRKWARDNLRGVSGVTIPSFSSDLSELNTAGIAHDIELMKALGFQFTLLMAEVNISPAENAHFTSVARDAAGSDFGLFFHAAFGTLADNIAAANLASDAGADIALLSYPPQFRPTTEQEIYDYTRAFCDAVDLPVMIFAIPTWGFERIHPSGMSVALVTRLVRDVPNIVAIKSEQGYPLIAGAIEMYHHFRNDIVISCPIEADAIPLMAHLDIQFSGTSNTQWMSDYYPKAFRAASSGRWEEAMESYWKVNPARKAQSSASASYASATGVINRTLWKYQDWLAGFNGGPLRAPAMRAPDHLMKSLRAGLVSSRLPVTDDDDSDFMRGRNPR